MDKEKWKLSTEEKKHFFKQTLLIALADVLNWLDRQLLYLDAPKRVSIRVSIRYKLLKHHK